MTVTKSTHLSLLKTASGASWTARLKVRGAMRSSSKMDWCLGLGAMVLLLRCCGEYLSVTRGVVKDKLKTLTSDLSLYISLKIRRYIIKSAYLKW